MTSAHRRVPAAFVGAAALVLAPLAAAPASAEPVSVQIVGINDFHGRIEPLSTGDSPTQDVGGAAMLAGALSSLRGDNPNTVFVSAGDNVGASPFVSAVQDDAPTIDVLNAMGLAVGAVGNHEFDRGYDWLADPDAHGVNGTAGEFAQWPTLGANVEGENPDMPEYELVDVGAATVGFVGVVTEQTRSLVSPDGIEGITFSDPLAAANRVADQLVDNDLADVVVLLAHEGSSATSCDSVATQGAFGRLVSGASDNIAAIISGHTHNQYLCFADPTDRPDLPVVVQSGEYGEAFSVLELTVETTTGAVLWQNAEIRPTTGYTPDADVAAIVAAAVEDAEVVGREPVGEITADIPRAFTEDGVEDRGAESPLGNFVADVQLAATAPDNLGGARIAFMNAGGLRADFCLAEGVSECATPTTGDGVVTYADAATVQPFANGVVTMTLTGAQVRQVLEEQWQPEGSSRPFLALGVSDGFFYTYDPDAAAGERVVDITLDGEPLDPAASYRVTVNSFLAAGGDNFATLAEGTDRQDNGFNDLNVLVDYFAANSPVTADTEPRRALAGDDAGEVPAPGAPGTGQPAPGQNPGLSVDTGVTAAPAGQPVAALVLAALLATFLGGLLLRRREGLR